MPKTYTIGRDPTADIPIADASVSRIHAEATLDESGGLFLTDCNSSNGTYVLRGGTEEQIRQQRLEPADQVKFGGVTIPVAAIIGAIHRKDPPPTPPSPAPPTPPSPAPAPKPRKGPKEYSDSTRLVRCSCGAVKAAGQRCPTCGV